MSGLGNKRKLDADVLAAEKMCSFKAEGIVRLLCASQEPTIMTCKRLLSVQKKDGGLHGAYTCTTLAGLPDRNLPLYDDQEDGSFKQATFYSCVDMTCNSKTFVLERDPAAVRIVDYKTKTVKTLNLDLEAIEHPVCLECGPEDKLYISTRTKIYAMSITSGKCKKFAEDVKFEEIHKLCMNYKENSLCVGDRRSIKFLSLEDPLETVVTEVPLAAKDEGAPMITGLECDRDGTLHVTRKTSNTLLRIQPNKETVVQHVMHAEGGIEDMALSGSGELWLVVFEGVEVNTGKARYSVLCAKGGMPEPKYMPDADLPLKRKFLESRIARKIRQQQRDELEHDLLHGSCTVKLDDDIPATTTVDNVRVNLSKLAGTFDYFAGLQRFPGSPETVSLHEISSDVFRDMLEFCYTGTLENKGHEMHKPEFLKPRLVAANMLQSKLMVEYLEQAFMEAVTHQNALAMLALAETLPVHSLVKRMREYMQENSKAIACMSGGAHAEKLSHESLHLFVKSMCGHLARSV